MKKRIGRKLLLLSVITLAITLCASSCVVIGGEDAVTKKEVQQMIDSGMNGNITVEGGDSYNVTINGADVNNVSAAKALLSSVSIRCVFETVSYGSTTSREKASAGSGVIYSLDKEMGNAYIVTNYHVVYNNQSKTENGISDQINVYLYGQENEMYAIPATYVGGSMNYDLAVLKVEGSRILAQSNAVAVRIADSDDVCVLDKAIAVGNPESLGISATLGHVNVESEYITMDGADGTTEIQIRVMRMDTSVNSGNSGGGLFNERGELIGIVNAKLTDTDNMSYAIPSNFVKYVVENILYYCADSELESVYRCYLGITVSPSKLYTVYDEERGIVHKREQVSVTEIERSGLAKNALRVGDVINSITIDGVTYEVDRMYIVTDTMLNARVGSEVVINVTRGGATLDVAIEIDEGALTRIS